MPTLIFAAVGAGVGAAVGGGAAAAIWTGIQIGAAVGGIVQGLLEHPTQQQGRVSDLTVSGSSYGAFIPIVYGQGRVGGNIIWMADIVEHESNQSVGGSKKGGGATIQNYTYSVSAAAAICKGNSNLQLDCVWGDDVILYQRGAGSNIFTPRFYQGTYTQAVDTLLQTWEASLGPAAPAFPSTATVCGLITDATTGEPVVGATVNFVSSAATTAAIYNAPDDELYNYTADLAAGTYTVTVSCADYDSSVSQSFIVLAGVLNRFDMQLQLTPGDTVAATSLTPLVADMTPAYRGTAYAVFEDMDLTTYFANRLPNLSFELSSTATVYLSDVIGDICTQVGLVEGTDYDVSAGATTVVQGFTITSQATAQDNINTLLACYPFDFVEVDGMLQLIVRGGASAVTIAAGDMGAVEIAAGDSPDATQTILSQVRAQDLDLPQRLDFTYANPANHFQNITQSAMRVGAGVQGVKAITANIVLDAAGARQTADRLLDTIWTERESWQFMLPIAYLGLAPADIITIPLLTGKTRRARVTQMQISSPGQIQVSAIRDNPQVLNQSIAGSGGVNPPPTTIQVVDTSFYAWSGMELQDADTAAPGFYVAATGPTGWQGCRIYYSPASGGAPTEWTPSVSITAKSVFGVTTDALANASTALAWDTTDTVNVNLAESAAGSPSLGSTTEAQVTTAGQNIMLVGQEILGSAICSLQMDGSYTLSTLYRGLRASTMTGHATGDAFVYCTTALGRVSLDPSLIGQEVYVRAVSNGQALDDTDVIAAQQLITIDTNHPAYVTTGTLSGSLPKPVPFFRVRGYQDGGLVGSGLDATYFEDGTGTPGANYPSATPTQHFWTWNCTGPGGSWIYDTPGVGYVLWLRMGILNATASPITFNWWVPAWDNVVNIWFNGSLVTSNPAFGTAGTITVPAGGPYEFDIFYKNNPVDYDPTDQGTGQVVIDAFEQTGLEWVDLGR